MKEYVDPDTGELLPVELDPPVKIHTGKRPDGSTYVDFDYTGCPSKTEQHHARETDINYLVSKYKPDELALYLATRGASRQLQFHDFTVEPEFQDSMNIVYKLNQYFGDLSEDLQAYFGSSLGLLKFADNPHNTIILQKLGLLKTQAKTELNNNNQTQNKNTQAPTSQSIKTEAPAPQGAK